VIVPEAIALGAYIGGPVVHYPDIDFSHPITVPARIEELEGWLSQEESRFNNIKKTIKKPFSGRAQQDSNAMVNRLCARFFRIETQ
jgi:hypothetical protein